MPLIKLDIIEGRKKEEITKMLDVIHEAVVEAFEVPERDRYQLVSQRKAHEMIIEDTGLGLDRTDEVVVISVVSNKRDKNKKIKFYELVTENLKTKCNIRKEDVMINITENSPADWSFGMGVAQFITGEL